MDRQPSPHCRAVPKSSLGHGPSHLESPLHEAYSVLVVVIPQDSRRNDGAYFLLVRNEVRLV